MKIHVLQFLFTIVNPISDPEISLRIVDQLGVVVWSDVVVNRYFSEEIEVDISFLPSGLYHLIMEGEKDVYSASVVKH